MHLFMIFLVYAIVGWLWETVYCSIKAKQFVYRGFLLGPYCPVYGFGVGFVLLLVPKNSGTLLNLYLNVVVIVTVVEFITSYLLEKLFHMTLWDYKNVPFNIEGRVAVPVSLFWGVGCVFLIKVVQPVVDHFITQFIQRTNGWGPIILLILFLADVCSTLLYSFQSKKVVSEALAQNNATNQNIKEKRLQQLFVNRKHPNRLNVLTFISQHEKHFVHKNLNRLIKNYPNIDFFKKEEKSRKQ